jgi:hypothetical protein
LGSALGGFLAQKFAEFTRPCPRVASLILCNTFTDTTIFKFAESVSMSVFIYFFPNPKVVELLTLATLYFKRKLTKLLSIFLRH